MLNRSIPPKIKAIEEIKIPSITHVRLDAGIDVFYVLDQSANAFKIEAIHKGGFRSLKSAGVSSMLNKMLLEGTESFKGQVFLEKIDALGSFMDASPSFDYGSLNLFGLSRFFEENIALFSSALNEAEYNEARLEEVKPKEINRIKLNEEQGSYLTSTQLRNCIFGNHPYGYMISAEQIESLTAIELHEAYASRVKDYSLFLSGQLPSNFMSILNQYFGHSAEPAHFDQTLDSTRSKSHYELRDTKYVQSSIRLGMKMFNRHHEDYVSFILLNEILGGYFGSRLMKNIREEKGYTYGISSHLYALEESGYFTIGTEVNQEAEEDTLIQIEKEINFLRNELVSEEELSTVKNYMLGSFANSLSAPFAAIDKFKVLHFQGLALGFYAKYLETLKNTTNETIRITAQKYLDFDKLQRAIVGHKA